jgi:hypothetical protein
MEWAEAIAALNRVYQTHFAAQIWELSPHHIFYNFFILQKNPLKPSLKHEKTNQITFLISQNFQVRTKLHLCSHSVSVSP